MKLLFFARIFSHTHIYTNTYTTVFHFSRFSREKERKIISSSASKNLFRTIRSPSKFNHSSLYLGKPARSKRPRFPFVARGKSSCLFVERCSALKDRSVTFDQRPRHVFPLHGLVIIDYMCGEVNNVAYQRVAASRSIRLSNLYRNTAWPCESPITHYCRGRLIAGLNGAN